MQEHEKNRHNIGIPSRFKKRGKSAHVKSQEFENDSVSEKLPSLIGEHKKFQDLMPNGRKIHVHSEMQNEIHKIDEEDHDWMMDSLGEFGSEIKSSQNLKDQ